MDILLQTMISEFSIKAPKDDPECPKIVPKWAALELKSIFLAKNKLYHYPPALNFQCQMNLLTDKHTKRNLLYFC